MAGIVCPECGRGKSLVVDSRTIADGIRRRRECEYCGKRYTTYECGNDLMRRLMNRGFQAGWERGIKKAEKERNGRNADEQTGKRGGLPDAGKNGRNEKESRPV